MSSRTDSIVKLAIVFFISLLSFSVGTFVGKKYSDNQHQMAMLEPQNSSTQNDREVASVDENHPEAAKKDAAMTDEEIAKLAQEFVADETSTDKPAASEEKKDQAHEDVKADHHQTPTAPSAKANPAAYEETPQKPAAKTNPVETLEERKPSSLPKNVAQHAVGKFTVQIASYADEAEAQKTASDLKNKGYSAFYIPATINGKTWYRVSVGQFATQKEAQNYRTEFISSSKMTAAIVQKISQ